MTSSVSVSWTCVDLILTKVEVVGVEHEFWQIEKLGD